MQQRLYGLIIWDIIFSHWFNLQIALWFHALNQSLHIDMGCPLENLSKFLLLGLKRKANNHYFTFTHLFISIHVRTSFSDKLMRSFELIITDTDVTQEYRLRYEGCKTILNVKQGFSALTNVSIRHQQWRGWPDDSDDSVSLGNQMVIMVGGGGVLWHQQCRGWPDNSDKWMS